MKRFFCFCLCACLLFYLAGCSRDNTPKNADATIRYHLAEEPASLLVAPVFKKGARTRKVTFPTGATWVNWNNPAQSFTGGTTATVAAPLDQLPMFVKAGSFIPQYTLPIENVEQYDPAFLTIKYFPSPDSSSFTMFDDDRKSQIGRAHV